MTLIAASKCPVMFQAEALRGDPEGFARQQVMLDDACQLVALAQAKVAELEANTPSLKEVRHLCDLERGGWGFGEHGCTQFQ